jgi:hypothetical protein
LEPLKRLLWIGTPRVSKVLVPGNPRVLIDVVGCGRPRKTWRKTVEEKAIEAGKTQNEVERLAANRTRWSFTDALCSRSYKN